MSPSTSPPLPPKLLQEIPIFERFFNQFGLKRTDGAVYGLLVLSNSTLSSEDIKEALGLSQSAVSQSLKALDQFGAIETHDARDIREARRKDRRCKFHSAREDSLKVVATVFRKREQQAIEEFKYMAKRVLAYDLTTKKTETPRIRRMTSSLSTCEVAEAVIDFLIELSQSRLPQEYPAIAKRLSKILQLLAHGMGSMREGEGNK